MSEVKHYAKRREPIRAVQWIGGEKTPELIELLGERGHYNADSQQLELGDGWYARIGDWITSTSGEDLAVIGDETFRKIYEEVDAIGQLIHINAQMFDGTIRVLGQQNLNMREQIMALTSANATLCRELEEACSKTGGVPSDDGAGADPVSASRREDKIMWLVVCNHCDKPKAPRGCAPVKESEAKDYCMRSCPGYEEWPYPSMLPNAGPPPKEEL